MSKRLVIVGDSFCADRKTETDWPIKLAAMLNIQLKGEGFGGRAWWTTRSWIYNNIELLDKDTILIVCHTNAERLPNRQHYPINAGILHSEVSSPTNDLRNVDPNGELFKLAKSFYLSDLYIPEFYDWAMNAWGQELHNLAPRVQKLIHIPGPGPLPMFQNYHVNSILIEPEIQYPTLFDLSMKELKNNLKKFYGPDARHNHLSEHNNIKLAEALYAVIQSPVTNGTMHFNNLEYWSFPGVNFQIRALGKYTK